MIDNKTIEINDNLNIENRLENKMKNNENEVINHTDTNKGTKKYIDCKILYIPRNTKKKIKDV